MADIDVLSHKKSSPTSAVLCGIDCGFLRRAVLLRNCWFQTSRALGQHNHKAGSACFGRDPCGCLSKTEELAGTAAFSVQFCSCRRALLRLDRNGNFDRPQLDLDWSCLVETRH